MRLCSKLFDYGRAAGLLPDSQGRLRLPQALTLAPLLLFVLLSTVLGTTLGVLQAREITQVQSIQQDLFARQTRNFQEKMDLFGKRLSPDAMKAEHQRLFSEGLALQKESDFARQQSYGLFFVKTYFPQVLFLFGCSIALALIGFWPLYVLWRCPRADKATVALASCSILGMSGGQLYCGYRELEGGGTGMDHMVSTLLGAAYGLGGGLAVGVIAYVLLQISLRAVSENVPAPNDLV